MSLIGDFKSGAILHLWLLGRAWLIRVCILSNPHTPSAGSMVCCSHQGLATQGRWPHWADYKNSQYTGAHMGVLTKIRGGWVLLWACESVWMPGGSHIQWPKTMVSLFTKPEPCLLRRAGISSHNRALDSLSLEPELHGDAFVQPFLLFLSWARQNSSSRRPSPAGVKTLPSSGSCGSSRESAETVVAGLPTLDKVLDLQAF